MKIMSMILTLSFLSIFQSGYIYVSMMERFEDMSFQMQELSAPMRFESVDAAGDLDGDPIPYCPDEGMISHEMKRNYEDITNQIYTLENNLGEVFQEISNNINVLCNGNYE